MGFLSGADAIIFDLRNKGGGSPTMIQLLSTYLFREPTHLNDIYQCEGDRRDQFWTLPWVDGERRPEVPVYVLTSARTFSAAEEFTNNLKVLKRATIVGETTGTNREGTGVEPDVEVPAAEALLAAQAAALDALAAKAKAPEEAARYRFARLVIEGQLPLYPAGGPRCRLRRPRTP
jgi:C-terminal processing protease CtpA/Prc